MSLCSCLNFDTRLAQCRDDAGAWICPDGGSTGGGGGSTGGGGGGTSDGGDGPEGLLCTRGWCWDHPRPSGVNLESVWGTSASDLWVGGPLGTLLHFDGVKWESHDRDGKYDFASICGHDTRVFFGAGSSTHSGNRLFTWNGTALSEVANTAEDINQLACGETALWIAREGGASRLDWTSSAATPQFTLSGNEHCTGVAEVSPGTCLTACMGNGTGTPFVRMRSCDGGVEYELVDTGGSRGPSFGVRALWTDPQRGVLAGIDGSRAEIWQRDLGWAPAWFWSGTGNHDIYAGAPYATGSIAVGAGGTVVDLDDAGFTERIETSSGNYVRGVWSPPSGNAWMVGDRGCILERDAGVWVPRSDCAVGFQDFATEPRLAAVTLDALYHRTATGWVKDKDLAGDQVSLWENPDGGGFAHLTGANLYYGDARLPPTLAGATLMHVVSEQQVVIATSGKLLLTTNLINGALSSFDAGVQISRLVGDPDGATVWAAGQGGALFHSTSTGGWTLESTGLTDGLTDFAIGFGRQWALSGTGLATRPIDGAWSVAPENNFDRVVPLDANRAMIINSLYDALIVDSFFATRPTSPPPDLLSGRIQVKGSEIWALGNQGGLVRFPIPP